MSHAHLVGLSMGGGIAQRIALEHPERVSTLCLASTSPAVPAEHDRKLPPPRPQVIATFTDPEPGPDWSDRDAVVAYRVEAERPYAGSLGFDEPHYRRLAAQEVDRTRDMAASMTNHFVLDYGTPTGSRLDQITALTLVLHGTTDPMFPSSMAEPSPPRSPACSWSPPRRRASTTAARTLGPGHRGNRRAHRTRLNSSCSSPSPRRTDSLTFTVGDRSEEVPT